MPRRFHLTFFAVLVVFALISNLAPVYAEDEKQEPEPPKAEEKSEPQDPMQVLRQTSYWIGVQVSPVPELLLGQFGETEDGKGLVVVAQIVPGSPAEKSGVKRGDIITKLGETEIHTLQDIVRCVAAAKDTEQTLTVIREGKKQELKITPSEKPEQLAGPGDMPGGMPFDWRRLQGRMPMMPPQGMPPGMQFGPETWIGPRDPQKMMEEMKDMMQRMPNGPDAGRPAQRLGRGSGKHLHVTSQTDADGNTKILVNQSITTDDGVANRTWEANDIEKLPDEIRGEVQKLFGK